MLHKLNLKERYRVIKYIINGEYTSASVSNCTYDAIRIIARRFPAIKNTFKNLDELVNNIHTVDSFSLKPALMDDSYTVTVMLREGDTYSEEVGREMALKKLHNKLDREVERRIRKWASHQHILLDYGVLNGHLK